MRIKRRGHGRGRRLSFGSVASIIAMATFIAFCVIIILGEII